MPIPVDAGYTFTDAGPWLITVTACGLLSMLLLLRDASAQGGRTTPDVGLELVTVVSTLVIWVAVAAFVPADVIVAGDVLNCAMAAEGNIAGIVISILFQIEFNGRAEYVCDW